TRVFPTAVGTRWTYRVLYPREYPLRDRDAEFVLTRVEEDGDSAIVTVDRVGYTGRVRPHRKLEVSDRGVTVVRYDALSGRICNCFGEDDGWELYEPPPHCLLKLPSRPGDNWTCPISRYDGRL